MDPAMIPPFPDLSTGWNAGPSVAGVPAGAPPATGFADLLAALSPVAETKVEAERFNQDGFFAASVVVPPSVSLAAMAVARVDAVLPVGPDVVAEPVGFQPTGQQIAPLPGREGSGVGRPVAGAAFPLGPTHPRPLPFREGRTTTISQGPSAPVAAPAPTITRRPVVQAVPSAPPIRPRPVPTGSFVALAVHATARGIEVAAQVAGLDDRDRAALADEVAALLSAHGYAPADITITAIHGARQERG